MSFRKRQSKNKYKIYILPEDFHMYACLTYTNLLNVQSKLTKSQHKRSLLRDRQTRQTTKLINIKLEFLFEQRRS